MAKAIQKLSPTVLRKQKGISFVGITTCFFVHDGNGRFFMAKRSKKARDEHGAWEVGGGGLKWGHTALANALREAKEEYGANPIQTAFLGYRDIFRSLPDGTQTHWVGLDFAIQADPKNIRVKEPDMFDDSGWFTLDNLPSPLHSQHLVFQRKYENELKKILGHRKFNISLSRQKIYNFLFN